MVARRLGTRAFLVSGSRTLLQSEFTREITSALHDTGVSTELLGNVAREPEVEDVDAAVKKLIGEFGTRDGDLLIALGGGSAIDLAKSVAAMVTNGRGASVQEFLEGVGSGRTIDTPPLPLLAIPTTSGTGAEVTRNAVISSYDPPFKKSLRSEHMIPDAVLVDPELTISLPATVTAHSGMDALTQCIESFISRRSQPIPRALARQGTALALASLREAVECPDSRIARENMAHAALLSGMALANSGLGLAHGVAASLGVHARVPHGLACAVMLPAAMRANREVAQAELFDLATACGHDVERRGEVEVVDEFLARIQSLAAAIDIPRTLAELGVTPAQLPEIVRGSYGNSMSGNPRDVSPEELHALLEGLL